MWVTIARWNPTQYVSCSILQIVLPNFERNVKTVSFTKSTHYDENGIGHCIGRSNNGYIVYIVSYIIFFITYISIVCCQSVRRKSPGNLIAMAIFTLSLSVWVSSIAVYHDVYWVFMAIGITAALCLGLTLFSFQTKIDFTGKYIPI